MDRIELDSSDFTNFYHLSCNYSLLHNLPPAVYYLKMAITKGAKGEDVLTDTDFETLRSEKLVWAEIEELLKRQYADRNPNISKLSMGFYALFGVAMQPNLLPSRRRSVLNHRLLLSAAGYHPRLLICMEMRVIRHRIGG